MLHEIPGLHPRVIDFARRIIAAGYTVYVPSLFGRPPLPFRCVPRVLQELARVVSA